MYTEQGCFGRESPHAQNTRSSDAICPRSNGAIFCILTDNIQEPSDEEFDFARLACVIIN